MNIMEHKIVNDILNDDMTMTKQQLGWFFSQYVLVLVKGFYYRVTQKS